jgi:hypothetical protein
MDWHKGCPGALAAAGLVISEEGDLVDTKTGKVINEFGATRFDVAVRALRGELDPAPWVEVSSNGGPLPYQHLLQQGQTLAAGSSLANT